MQETNFPFEVLLAEDESNDKTREICLNYAEKYPEKIRLFLHSRLNNIQVLEEPTANFPAMYNLFSAKGKYIAVCEGDDYWTDPHKLQKQYSFMEKNPEYSICYHDFKIITNNKEEKLSSVASSLQENLEAVELLFPWKHPATLTSFFQNIFKEIPIEASKVINLDIFLYSLLGRFGKGKFLKNISPAGYRVHSTGLWSSRTSDKKSLSRIITYRELANYYRRIDEPISALKFKRRNYKIYHGLIYSNSISYQYMKTLSYLKEYLKYKTNKNI